MSTIPGESLQDRVTLRFLATPADTAAGGRSVAAGSVMEWIDRAGYACAARWSKAYCVTAYVGSLSHRRPIPAGSIVEVQARLVLTGRTSMHVVVAVSSAELPDQAFSAATTCILVFVAKGADGRPAAVPTWIPATQSDRELSTAAQQRAGSRDEIRSMMLQPGDRSASGAERMTLRFLAPPQVVNWGGNVHGGTVMRWIDEAAYACSASWSRTTARACAAVGIYSGEIHFLAPVQIGDLVEVDARIVDTTARSIHLNISVATADPRTPRKRRLTTQCTSIFAIPGDDGKALPVRQWDPLTPADLRLREHAREVARLSAQTKPIPSSLALAP
jgi:acyl-CoA hydrolase